MQGYRFGGRFARRNRNALGRKGVIFLVQHRPRRTETGIVPCNEPRIHRNGHRYVLLRGICQRRGESLVQFVEGVFNRCRLYVRRFGYVEIDYIAEFVVVGVVIRTSRLD